MNKKTQEALKEKLLQKKAELINELKSFADPDTHIPDNWQTRFPQFGDHRSEQDENADETEEYINRLSIEHTLELQLRDVRIALEKMEKGNYGQCEKCQGKIEKERLQALPEARLCLACSRLAKRQAKEGQ